MKYKKPLEPTSSFKEISHDIVQRNDGLLLMVILMMILIFFVFCLAGQEHWVSPFKFVQTRSIGCRLLSSCKQ